MGPEDVSGDPGARPAIIWPQLRMTQSSEREKNDIAPGVSESRTASQREREGETTA